MNEYNPDFVVHVHVHAFLILQGVEKHFSSSGNTPLSTFELEQEQYSSCCVA